MCYELRGESKCYIAKDIQLNGSFAYPLIISLILSEATGANVSSFETHHKDVSFHYVS